MEHFKQRQPLSSDRAYGWSMTDQPKPRRRKTHPQQPSPEEDGPTAEQAAGKGDGSNPQPALDTR